MAPASGKRLSHSSSLSSVIFISSISRPSTPKLPKNRAAILAIARAAVEEARLQYDLHAAAARAKGVVICDYISPTDEEIEANADKYAKEYIHTGAWEPNVWKKIKRIDKAISKKKPGLVKKFSETSLNLLNKLKEPFRAPFRRDIEAESQRRRKVQQEQLKSCLRSSASLSEIDVSRGGTGRDSSRPSGLRRPSTWGLSGTETRRGTTTPTSRASSSRSHSNPARPVPQTSPDVSQEQPYLNAPGLSNSSGDELPRYEDLLEEQQGSSKRQKLRFASEVEFEVFDPKLSVSQNSQPKKKPPQNPDISPPIPGPSISNPSPSLSGRTKQQSTSSSSTGLINDVDPRSSLRSRRNTISEPLPAPRRHNSHGRVPLDGRSSIYRLQAESDPAVHISPLDSNRNRRTSALSSGHTFETDFDSDLEAEDAEGGVYSADEAYYHLPDRRRWRDSASDTANARRREEPLLNTVLRRRAETMSILPDPGEQNHADSYRPSRDERELEEFRLLMIGRVQDVMEQSLDSES